MAIAPPIIMRNNPGRYGKNPRPLLWAEEDFGQRAERRYFLRCLDIITEVVELAMVGEISLYQLHETLMELQEDFLIPTFDKSGRVTSR